MKRTAAHALVETLENQGVDRVFCVPGESYLDVLDALRDSPIETVVARQEGGAAMMAEADAKLTGRPGVVFVTRGTGCRQRQFGRSRGPAGLDAAGALRRPGGARRAGSRRLPGDRLRGVLRRDGQVRGGGRRS